jgi:signal transduction histidine kinase
MFNPAAERLLGLRMGEYGDTAWSQNGGLFLPDRKTPFPESALPVTHALQGHASGGIEMFIKNQAVPYGMYVLATATPLQDDTGKLLGCVMVFRDVTAHKQLEVELKNYSAELEEKVRIRTAELEQYLAVLHQEEAKEKALLESIGDGVIATDIVKLADDVLRELAVQISHKGLVVEKDVPVPLPIVNIDPTLVRMILQNLLFNAVKYTPEKGKIMLHMEVLGPELSIRIADTGHGIPAEDQERIFTKLFRAKNARFIDSSGTGLGLYIVKRIVDEVGGRVRFESTEGRGTTFFVTIPIEEKLGVQS